ncbi:MAG: UbiH/UbiF/VisC/COQ6 family ubiquinone biosynthesis hydroxylase [Gammaproteobacteria bacterium]|nr:UbiH/UbiF/VisC/COQ6 family ubiquinone biosynthesis hydroxylase [Gammaproteobacteria bacterium]
MAETKRFDIVIVGAGIAGSSLAAALSGEGLSIALIEAQPLVLPDLPAGCDLQQFDPRVSALTPRSRQLLEGLDAWEAIAGYRQCPYRHMTVWDAEGTGQVEFDASEVNAPALGHIVENRAIISALLQRVSNAGDITLFSPARLATCSRLDCGAVCIGLEDGAALEAELLVAADGAMSRVRDMMDFQTREWDYGHRAIVATVQVEQAHQDTAWQRFLPSGPLALLPLPGDDDRHFCSIVWSLQEDLVDDLLALDDASFCTELERAFEQRLGRVLAVSRRFAFPLRQRHAVDYVQPGVALVADAAHTIHPLAGQGINLGLQDVAVLAEEILSGRARGAKPGQLELLRRYQRRRKGENLMMMAAMDGFKKLFEQQALPLRWLRNVGMRGVNQLPPVKQQLMRHAMGLG